MSKQPMYKMSRGDIVAHSFAGVYALPTQAQNERLVECANAFEPGGTVDVLVRAVDALAMVHEVVPSADIGSMDENWKMIRAALEPFNDS